MPTNPVLSIDASKVREDGNHLAWDSATADDGSTLTILDQYLLFSDESTASASFVKVSVEGNLHTLLSLTDGVTYLVKLAQETAEEGILFSNTLSLLATSKPAAPVISSIVGKDNGLQIAITHGSDGGSAMSKITFLLADGSDIYTVVKSLSYVSGQPAPSSFLLETADNPAIINDKTFEIACYTTNPRGDSPLSAAQLGTPSNYPDAPRDVAVVVGNQSAVLSFKHPLDFAAYSGHSTLNYEVQYRASGASEWISIIDAVNSLDNVFPSLTLSELSLTNGYIYEFKIRYINDFGEGLFSFVVSGMSYQLASAPVITSAVAGNQQIVVNWSVPSSLGGGVLSKYEIKENSTLVATVNAGSPTSATISSLANGTPYSISIQAFTNVNGVEYGGAIASQYSRTAQGDSPPSPDQVVIPFANPVVSSVSVVGGDTLRASIQLNGRKLLKLHGLALDADPSPS